MRRIKVVGLGPGSKDKITVRAWESLLSARRVFFRTEYHPIMEELKKRGLKFNTFDYLYEREENFEDVYQAMVNHLLKEAKTLPKEEEEIVFAVPGHPLVAERSVEILLDQSKKEEVELEIIPAMSSVEAVYTALGIDPTRGLCILDGLRLKEIQLRKDIYNIILQIYNSYIASEVKLFLMEYYPDDYEIYVVRAAGIPDMERIEKIPLFKLDRLPWVDHLTSVCIAPDKSLTARNKVSGSGLYPLDPLVEVIDALLGPEGCPWDREQTHTSLRSCLIEEVYEVIAAIDAHDMDNLAEELGDLLLQIVFHAALARQHEYFDINDVIMRITQKMIRRHPHVFGKEEVSSVQEVLVNWEEIKCQEKKEVSSTYLENIPATLPILIRAKKIQAMAARVGFDWPSIEGVWDKVKEEMKELEQAYHQSDKEKVTEEAGDLLFSIVNLARFLEIDLEMALTQTINKFIRRFNYIEKISAERGKELQDLILEEMDNLWNKAKKLES